MIAIWFEMFPGDARSKWPRTLLSDPRVRHFWDGQKLAGRWFGEHVTRKQPELVEWDAWILYGAGARWSEAGETTLGWGRTIVASREQLGRDLEAVLGDE